VLGGQRGTEATPRVSVIRIPIDNAAERGCGCGRSPRAHLEQSEVVQRANRRRVCLEQLLEGQACLAVLTEAQQDDAKLIERFRVAARGCHG